jgi:hypothetical protein
MTTCAWFLPALADLGVDQRKIAAITRRNVDCVGIAIEPPRPRPIRWPATPTSSR